MNVNCVGIGREEEFLNVTNIILLTGFNKTREIFSQCYPSFNHSSNNSSYQCNAERANYKKRVQKVPGSSPNASYAHM